MTSKAVSPSDFYCKELIETSTDCKMYVILVSSFLSNRLRLKIPAVLSGDTLILRNRAGPQGQPPKERCVTFVLDLSWSAQEAISLLHLADLTSPRLGTATREDEVFYILHIPFLEIYSLTISRGDLKLENSCGNSP